MRRVVVIGGGIAGLATAYELAERAEAVDGGLDVRVLEAGPRPGGNLRTERDGGYRVEWGPNGFLDSVPETLDLVRRLGIERRLVRADPLAARRFLFRHGRLRELPTGPGSFLAGDVLSLRGRLRVLAEPFAPSLPEGDETVFDFARRRIGVEAATVLVGAMVSGVFAGDARELSLAACFPKMAEMERRHGSLFRAMLARRRERRAASDGAAGARGGGPAGPAGTLTSFDDGIETFAESLAAALGERCETGRPVDALRRAGERWEVFAGDAVLPADDVVLALPAARARPLVETLDRELAALLGAIPAAPLAVVALAFDASATGGPPRGFGFLVPRGEGPRILGCLWDSSLFPGRAPAGKVLLRAMVGGAHDPDAVALSDAELVGAVRADLARTMGLATAPEREWVFRHRLGISQYVTGHLERLAAIDDRLALLPGLHLAGQSYRGVAMNACAERAPRLAEALLARPAA